MRMALASEDPEVRRWLAPVTNNLGWHYYSLGQFDEALSCFEEAERVRSAAGGMPHRIARYCVAKCKRALGRVDESLDEQTSIARDHEGAGTKGYYVYEEIGECLLVLGRPEEARPYFAKAFEGLKDDVHLQAEEPDRLQRMAELAG
jgi:tetratricopeptide (TPR) repeat protein